MKKLINTLLLSLMCVITLAQAPQSFEYQAAVRDASGNILANQAVGIQISLKQGSASGIITYQETFNASTNQYGLINLQIGTGSTSYNFSTINWTNGPYFVEVALDITGGTSYTVMGTSQLLSVPYALHAKTVEIDSVNDADADSTNELQTLTLSNDTLSITKGNSVVLPSNNGGKTYIVLSGAITDAQAATKIANELGVNTQFVLIQNTTNLTTVDLTGITDLVDLLVVNNQNLSTLNTPNLSNVFRNLSVTNNATLTGVSFPILSSIFGNLTIGNNAVLTSVSLPALTSGNPFIVGNTVLTSVSLPALTSGNPSIQSNSALTSVSLSALASGNPIIAGNTVLTSVSLPALTSITPISSPSGIGGVEWSNNAFTVATVNYLLGVLVAATPTLSGVTITLNNQTPLAAPTGQGITDKNTLISNGNTVITD